MPNTLGPIVPKILAMGLISLREKCVLRRLVTASYSSEAAMFGATVDVPIPTKQVAADITPSNTPPARRRFTLYLPCESSRGASIDGKIHADLSLKVE